MIGKLFSKKSNNGFYLQIDETEVAAEATPAAAPVEAAPEPVAAATSEATATQPKASKSKKKKATANPVATTPVAPQVEEPIWVKAISNSTNGKVQKENNSFATDNLLPLPSARRRPGPSMSAFLDMARQTKQ